jgi:type VI secretion system protein ImpF
MASSYQASAPTLSVFERLTDERPTVTRESVYELLVGVPEFTASVLVHLEALLNTRRSDADFQPDYTEANESVISYGVSDFTSMSSADPCERDRMRRSVERAIRLFEPRLSHVEVTLSDLDAGVNAIRLKIEGLLRLAPDPEPILLEAVMAKDSRQIRVIEGA